MKNKKHRSYFEGWYWKLQGEEGCMALIPSFHIEEDGMHRACLQIITELDSYEVWFPASEFEIGGRGNYIRLGRMFFSRQRIHLDLEQDGISLKGNVRLGVWEKPAYDIMGPFSLISMQCRHRIYSLRHQVNGAIELNGRKIYFDQGSGYLEGDSGSSFPKHYLWTQATKGEISIVFAVADILLYKKRFKGCIGIVWINGKEYRIATYLGAHVLYMGRRKTIVKQGESVLEIRLIDATFHTLKAPKCGRMGREIQESVACCVEYRFVHKGITLVNMRSHQAGYEVE